MTIISPEAIARVKEMAENSNVSKYQPMPEISVTGVVKSKQTFFDRIINGVQRLGGAVSTIQPTVRHESNLGLHIIIAVGLVGLFWFMKKK